VDVVESTVNSLLVQCVSGESLTVFPDFIATGGFHVKPVASRDILLSRLFAGRLLECHYEAHGESQAVQLHHASNRHGRFLVVQVSEGQAMAVRLDALAAYRFGDGGRFSVSRKFVLPVRWFTRTVIAVVAHGPADLIFYGEDLASIEPRDHQQCFADRLVAFDAHVPFRIQGLRPEGHAGACFDALSTVVDVIFCQPTPLVRRTVVQGQRAGSKVGKAASLIFGGLILGSFIERFLFSQWLWSWIS
jgi:hypothetical protein